MVSKRIIFFICVLFPLLVYAAIKTIDTAGTWSDTGIWTGGIPGTTGDNVTVNDNLGTITATSDVTVTTLNMGNGNTLTINSGVNFTIDNLGLDALITGNNIILNIVGDLVVNGNLVVQNNLTLNVTGSIIVNGNVTIQNNGALNIDGAVSVTGDLTANNGTDFGVNGTLDVGGTLTAGNNSTSTGAGTITAGACVGDIDVCSTVTPIKLLFFNARAEISSVSLDWATYEEENFDYFSVERSHDGIDFSEIGQVKGLGWSYSIVNYSLEDNHPISGRSYYRLKTVDLDGYTEYFQIVTIVFNGVSDVFSVYPNPVNGEYLHFSIDRDPGANGTLRAFSIQGNEVFSMSLQKGKLRYTISDFKQKGLFVFKVELGQEAFQQKVIIH